jgi:hypothetical protein
MESHIGAKEFYGETLPAYTQIMSSYIETLECDSETLEGDSQTMASYTEAKEFYNSVRIIQTIVCNKSYADTLQAMTSYIETMGSDNETLHCDGQIMWILAGKGQPSLRGTPPSKGNHRKTVLTLALNKV